MSLHDYGVKFYAKEVEAGGWSLNLGGLEAKPKLVSKAQHPLQCLSNKFQRCVRPENGQEVIQVVAETGWDVLFQDPVKCLCKKVEDVWA